MLELALGPRPSGARVGFLVKQCWSVGRIAGIQSAEEHQWEFLPFAWQSQALRRPLAVLTPSLWKNSMSNWCNVTFLFLDLYLGIVAFVFSLTYPPWQSFWYFEIQKYNPWGLLFNRGDLYCDVLNDLSTFQANALKNKLPYVHSTSAFPSITLRANHRMLLWRLIEGLYWLVLLKSHLRDWFLLSTLVVFHRDS